jgi:hypothetical protein
MDLWRWPLCSQLGKYYLGNELPLTAFWPYLRQRNAASPGGSRSVGVWYAASIEAVGPFARLDCFSFRLKRAIFNQSSTGFHGSNRCTNLYYSLRLRYNLQLYKATISSREELITFLPSTMVLINMNTACSHRERGNYGRHYICASQYKVWARDISTQTAFPKQNKSIKQQTWESFILVLQLQLLTKPQPWDTVVLQNIYFPSAP